MTSSRASEPWTTHDDFVLMMLIGQQPFSQIALRLGRAESAVQRRASYKGYSAHGERRVDRVRRTTRNQHIQKKNLLATDEELAEFLPPTD